MRGFIRASPATAQPHQHRLDMAIRLNQFIEEVLQKNSTPTIEKLLEEWIYLLACKESIKAQDSLSLLEMEQLIALLGKSHNPIFKIDLSKFFGSRIINAFAKEGIIIV